MVLYLSLPQPQKQMMEIIVNWFESVTLQLIVALIGEVRAEYLNMMDQYH